MPIPPRVSVVALRTADLARSTTFYVALGWELSAASTAAMSLFKTAGSLLLVRTDELLIELAATRWPPPSRASRPAKSFCPFTWPPTSRSTPRSKRRPEPAGS
jgi:catechol 2,3-dioxygenase-like lactoylglutathione lyase family enzyme